MAARAAWKPTVSMAIFLATKVARRMARGEWKNAWAVVQTVPDYWKQRRKVYRETV